MQWKHTTLSDTAIQLLDDDQVIALIPDNPDAFEVLYKRYVQQIYRYCLKRTSNVQIAEDLCSEIFITVLHKLKTYQAGNFAAWLFTIAHHAVVDHYRKQKPVVALDNIQMEGESQMVQTITNQLLLAELLADLTDSERELLVLRLEAELSAPEIAKRTGQTANAVRVQIYRLLKRLRDRYNTTMGEEA
ncbi:MAG: sigma-70 family RNA polymerase sigma factor [Phototrophicaceae bacterium]